MTNNFKIINNYSNKKFDIVIFFIILKTMIKSNTNFNLHNLLKPIKGNKILGKQIYAKLYNLLKSNNNNPAAQSINI